MLHLAVALVPESVSDSAAWQNWLHSLVRSEPPSNVRFMVVDSGETPLLDELATSEPKLVQTVAPELDMMGAVRELVREAGGFGPGVAFRRHFISLTESAAKGDLLKAKHLADTAASIAAEQAWADQQVVIHMTMGAAYLAAGKTAEALATYRKAGQAAADAASHGHVAGPKLVVQARLCEGGALLADSRHSEAAKVYEAAAVDAAAQKDHMVTLESWRMAAFCHEMAKETDAAWQCGWKAIEAGSLLEAQHRPNSTLPYVGQRLLVLAQDRAYADKADDVRKRMTTLLGSGWEKMLEQKPTP
jgi:hypothetical protein